MPEQGRGADDRNARPAMRHCDPGDLHARLWLRQFESTRLSVFDIQGEQFAHGLFRLLRSVRGVLLSWWVNRPASRIAPRGQAITGWEAKP